MTVTLCGSVSHITPSQILARLTCCHAGLLFGTPRPFDAWCCLVSFRMFFVCCNRSHEVDLGEGMRNGDIEQTHIGIRCNVSAGCPIFHPIFPAAQSGPLFLVFWYVFSFTSFLTFFVIAILKFLRKDNLFRIYIFFLRIFVHFPAKAKKHNRIKHPQMHLLRDCALCCILCFLSTYCGATQCLLLVYSTVFSRITCWSARMVVFRLPQ